MNKSVSALLSTLPLSDNFMFGEVMRTESVCKLFLEELLQIQIERIEYLEAEDTLSTAHGAHGIRLDVHIKDSGGKVYDVEMQTQNRKDIERRGRYYQSGMDHHILEKNLGYKALPESYVIFICTFDYFGKGYAVYERKSHLDCCPDLTYDDGSHVLVLNSMYTKANTSSAVQEFLRLVNDEEFSAQTLLGQETHKTVEYVRHDKEKEDLLMTYSMKIQETLEDGIEIGFAQGIKQGIEQGIDKGIVLGGKMFVESMRAQGRSDQEISDFTGLPLEEVEKYS